MEDKFNKFNNQEFPDYIVQAISDVVTQYSLEYGVEKNKDAMLRFSKFAEHVMQNTQEGMIFAHSNKFSDKDFIMAFLGKRKELIKNNLKLFKQLAHLEQYDIPDYALDSIIKGVNFILSENEEFLEFENEDFYCLFGENLILDIRNYMQLEKVKRNK